jgi:hypothetical protein
MVILFIYNSKGANFGRKIFTCVVRYSYTDQQHSAPHASSLLGWAPDNIQDNFPSNFVVLIGMRYR